MFEAESLVGYKICEVNDIPANTMWLWAGAIGVSSYRGLISPSYNIYRQIDSQYDNVYLDYLLRATPLASIYTTTTARPRITHRRHSQTGKRAFPKMRSMSLFGLLRRLCIISMSRFSIIGTARLRLPTASPNVPTALFVRTAFVVVAARLKYCEEERYIEKRIFKQLRKAECFSARQYRRKGLFSTS